MYTKDDLRSMTVAQLRKYGKEQGIDLQTGILKANLIEIISERLSIKEANEDLIQNDEDGLSMQRNARIVSDDFDDEPILTVNRPRAKDTVEATKAIQPPAAKTNKPTFSLQGAKAWHNPQPYFQQQVTNKYTVSQAQPINTVLSNQQGLTDAKPLAPRPQPYSRFGPEIATPAEPPAPQWQGATRISMQGSSPVLQRPETQVRTPSQVYTPRFGQALSSRQYAGGYGDNVPSQESIINSTETVEGSGVLELLAEGHGILKPKNSTSEREYIYVSAAQIRRFGLRNGDFVEGKIRAQREGDKYAALLYTVSINGEDIESRRQRPGFDSLSSIYPNERIDVSSKKHNALFLRMIDIFAPIGYGSRVLLKNHATVDKREVFINLVESIKDYQGQIYPIAFINDEKPEDIGEVRRDLGVEIFSTTFFDTCDRQTQVCELAIERAMRLAESGQHVFLLVNDFASICRAYDNSSLVNVRPLSSELSELGLRRAMRLLGLANNFKEGGSVTVVANLDMKDETANLIARSVERNINCLLSLTKSEKDKMILDIIESYTLRGQVLRSRDEDSIYERIHRHLSPRKEKEVREFVLSILQKTETNRELASKFDSWMQMMEDNR